MEKLTVLQLSKRTGLSRTQIYYLERQNKINIINGKIDLEEAMPAIIELLDKKSNKGSETNFKLTDFTKYLFTGAVRKG
ncbi:hypothetical protein ACT4X4_10380 [Acinetobacter baumannii]|nr:hypothetical protein [Acinetobacter baumannii]